MNIREYISQVKESRRKKYLSQSASEVLLKKVNYEITDWDSVMESGGYYCIVPRSISKWSEMHIWLQDNIGQDRYSWNGNHF